MSAATEMREAVEAAIPAARGARVAIYAIGVLIVAGVIGFGIWWIFIHPRQLRAAAAQAKVDTQIARGTAAAAVDTVHIVVDHDRTITRIDHITEGNQRAILAAPGADAPVDPAVMAALHDALCLRGAYQSDGDCAALRESGAGLGPAPADTGRGAAESADRR